MSRWYVVQTQTNGENRAKLNLERQGFEAYLPRYLKRRRHARRVEQVKRPLFPGYLFVRFDPNRTRWRSINGTFGVTHLMSHGGDPVPVPNNTVDSIQAREDANGLIDMDPAGSFSPGQQVEIVEGPFAWHTAIFQQLSDNDRVVLLLDLLGWRLPVSVARGAVTAA